MAVTLERSHSIMLCGLHSWSMCLFFVVVSFRSFISLNSTKGAAVSFNNYQEGLSFFVLSKIMLVYFLFWGIVILLTLFFLWINDKFGPWMYLKFLVGKYYQPREDDWIFMFMDLQSSTSIAEKIGSKRHCNLINDASTNITNSILISGGQIYQYVRDEVVISWELSKGLDHANCIRCFTRIKDKLLSKDNYYYERYGLHLGTLTFGEIGSINIDIVYSGDVHDTTSRIQEQCKHYEVDFLISTDTLKALESNLRYKAIPIGNIELRGKKECSRIKYPGI